jgi:hypothetical protein
VTLSSVTNTFGHSASMIVSRDRSRPAFSTSSRNSANDLGRSGISAPSIANSALREIQRVGAKPIGNVLS